MIVLSRRADVDLEQIYEYGFEAFGRHAARQYAVGLWDIFGLLEAQPGIGKAVEGDRSARVTTYKAHRVYYSAAPDGVRILRVLSPRQSPPDQF